MLVGLNRSAFADRGGFGYTRPMRPAALFVLLAACQEEIDIPYQGAGEHRVGAALFREDGQRLLDPAGAMVAERLYTPPVSDGTHLCAADEGKDGMGQLRCWDAELRERTLSVGDRPDRIALGEGHVAWVASSDGLPKIFVAPLDGSADPRILTNVGLRHVPAKPPVGFVPPPLRQTLRFDGDWLRWDTAEGPRSVKWR